MSYNEVQKWKSTQLELDSSQALGFLISPSPCLLHSHTKQNTCAMCFTLHMPGHSIHFSSLLPACELPAGKKVLGSDCQLSLLASYCCHTFHIFKQHKFIILHFWRSEVQNQSHWPKIKMVAGPVLPWDCRREYMLLFLAARGYLPFLTCGFLSHLLFLPLSVITSS